MIFVVEVINITVKRKTVVDQGKDRQTDRQIVGIQTASQVDNTSKVLPSDVLHRDTLALLIAAFCLRLKLDLFRGIAAKERLKSRKKNIEIKSKIFVENDFASVIANRGETCFLSCISSDLFVTQFLVVSFGPR